VSAAGLCAVAGLLAGTGATGALDLADRAQLSSRVAAPGQRQAPVDLENGATALLTVSAAPLQLRLGYGPQYTLVDAFDERARARVLLQAGFAQLSLGRAGQVLSLNATGSIGEQSFARLVSAPVDPAARADPATSRVDFLPAANAPLPIASWSAGLVFSQPWSARWRSTFAVTYGESGGRGEAAQMILPQQQTATAGVSTTFAASRLDQLAGGVEAVNTRASSGLDYSGLGLALAWSRRLAPRTALRLGAGAIAGRQRDVRLGATRPTLEGTASAVLTTDLLRAHDLLVSLAVGASVAPQVASLTGVRQQRTQGAATLTAQLFQRTTVTATVDATQTLPLEDPHEARIVGAGVSASHRVGDLIDLVAGYRTAWQQSRDPFIASLPRQWFAYLGVALRTPSLTF